MPWQSVKEMRVKMKEYGPLFCFRKKVSERMKGRKRTSSSSSAIPEAEH
jgi:hypothetical protein